MPELNKKEDDGMSAEAVIGIIALAISVFFGTIDFIWMKSYYFDLPKIAHTQFGWMTFSAAISALLAIVAIGMLGYVFIQNSGPFVGFLSKVGKGVWGVCITIAVAYLIAKQLHVLGV